MKACVGIHALFLLGLFYFLVGLSGPISYYFFTMYLVTIITALHYMGALHELKQSEFLAGKNHVAA